MTDFIKNLFKHELGITPTSATPISGGCINSTFKVETQTNTFFLKYNHKGLESMFDAEEKGLTLLKSHSPIHIPKPISHGVHADKSYLVTEWIERGTPKASFWDDFGTKLAKQHRHSSTVFGLDHDNYIGSLPQSNTPHRKWSAFFVSERLTPQLKLAEQRQLIEPPLLRKFDQLFTQLDHLIPEEPPALLHGDLWNGNFMIGAAGYAAIFDPAVYYGHRETELAFTQLFGGFSPVFYQAYHREWPLEPGFQERADIHNLYPLLVHVNLFGPSYLSGIFETLKRFS